MKEKFLTTDFCMLDRVLNKIKMIIDIEKWDNTEKFPNDFTSKNVAILITCITKDGDKFYAQQFLEEASVT